MTAFLRLGRAGIIFASVLLYALEVQDMTNIPIRNDAFRNTCELQPVWDDESAQSLLLIRGNSARTCLRRIARSVGSDEEFYRAAVPDVGDATASGDNGLLFLWMQPVGSQGFCPEHRSLVRALGRGRTGRPGEAHALVCANSFPPPLPVALRVQDQQTLETSPLRRCDPNGDYDISNWATVNDDCSSWFYNAFYENARISSPAFAEQWCVRLSPHSTRDREPPLRRRPPLPHPTPQVLLREHDRFRPIRRGVLRDSLVATTDRGLLCARLRPGLRGLHHPRQLLRLRYVWSRPHLLTDLASIADSPRPCVVASESIYPAQASSGTAGLRT